MDAPKKLQIDASDALGAAGAACILAGAWMAYPPAALIVLGAALLAAAFRMARA